MNETRLTYEVDYENADKGYSYGHEGPYLARGTRGELFRDMQAAFGRVKSAMYREYPDGSSKKVGWVFESRVRYSDALPSWPKDEQTYLRVVWVEVREIEYRD